MPTDALSDFPDQFEDGPIPLFTTEGCLPPGDFLPSKSEFESRFVNAGDRERRDFIYRGWNDHRQALLHAGVAGRARQLLNGSYTTAKSSPGDIDLAAEVPLPGSGALLTLSPDHPVVRLLQGQHTKPLYQCDAYPIYVLPNDDRLYASVTTGAIEYWTKWFGRSRSGTPKGRVWATTGGLK
jgi:hypothetical protein